MWEFILFSDVISKVIALGCYSVRSYLFMKFNTKSFLEHVLRTMLQSLFGDSLLARHITCHGAIVGAALIIV